MACNHMHFDVPVINHLSVPIDEPQTVHLTKTSTVHVINVDPCGNSLDICIKRVVKCQRGCAFEEYEHDFPIDGRDPILPPGEYRVTVPERGVVMGDGAVIPLDIIFEEVTDEYVQALIANKSRC